ncbi:MAG: chiE, partial [Verrucomicrobiales bacterium]|nr:chiE [Verrucomicrobiales bacterium]
EAHGTGTLLGDPIEVEALKKAFKPFTDRSHFCALGSVKANIGHTEGTAGIAGVIKAILCMKHGFIPAMPGLREVNPYLKLDGSPFFINPEGREWAQPEEHARRAGVSSFGMGGAYAHVVVEDYTDNRVSVLGDGLHCLVLSAQNEVRLKEHAGRYSEFLAHSGDNVSLPDLCYSLRMGRQSMDQRLAIVFESKEQLKELLNVYRSDLKHPDIFTGKRSPSSLTAETKGEPRDRASYRELMSAWVTGTDIQWDKWNDGKRISLPTYPFERRRCWMPPTGREGPDVAIASSSVLGPFIDTIVPSLNGALFVKSFSGAENLLKDHCVFGKSVLPGVAHLEMALAAARLLHPGENPILRNVFWKQPILVGAGGLRCEINLKSADSSLAWSICSGVTEYTTGLIDLGAGNGSRERIFDITLIKSRLSQKEQGTNLYERFSAVGIEYGPLFRSVKQVWANDREALSEIVVEGSELRSTRALDAMLQSALTLYRKGVETLDPCLPFAFDSAILGTDFPSVCFGYLTADTPPNPGEEAVVNFFLLNTEGAVLAEIRELNLRLARRTQSSPVNAIPPIQYFRPRWKKESQNIRFRPAPAQMLIFHHGNDSALAETLGKHKLGEEAVFVQLDSKYEKLDRNRYSIDGKNIAHFGAVLGELNSIETVYFLGALPSGSDRGFTLQEACRWNAYSFLHLVQALPSEQKLELKVLTREVYSVSGMEDLQPCGAIAVGLAKVTAREFPNWTVSCIDIDEISNGLIASIEHEISGECSFRNGERFVRVLDAVELPPTSGTGLPQSIPFREKGVYLIAGGKGGLGLALSEYLAKEFKARLILLGRSPIDPQQAVLLQRLEALGGEVIYIQADIADSAEMQMALKTPKDRFGRINGLVHSALVLADQAVVRLDDENLFSVLRPKVEGTIALEEVTRDEPLDFVLYFSSLNSFLANTGQSNYVAGCAFQDAFAESLRRHRRCPVYTINWGLWGEVGIMARQGQPDRFSRLGVYPIGVSEGIASCVRILASDISQMIAAKIDSTALAASGLRIEGFQQLLPSGCSSITGIKSEIAAIEKSAAANVASWSSGLQDIDAFCIQRLSNIHGLPGAEPPKTWKPKFHSLWSATATLLINQGRTVVDGEHNSVFEAHFELAGRCLDAFTDIVSGKVAATEVLFPNSSMELLEPIYSGNPFADFYNELSAESVGICLRRLLQAAPDRAIRVLEIGAGTGGTSRFVLEKIAKVISDEGIASGRVQYVYTDLSDGFLHHGRERFGAKYSFVEFRA